MKIEKNLIIEEDVVKDLLVIVILDDDEEMKNVFNDFLNIVSVIKILKF